MESKPNRRRSSYDLHLQRNSGQAMLFDVAEVPPSSTDTNVIQSNLRELGVDMDEHTINRFQSMDFSRTFLIANKAADLIRQRRRSTASFKFDTPSQSQLYQNFNSNNTESFTHTGGIAFNINNIAPTFNTQSQPQQTTTRSRSLSTILKDIRPSNIPTSPPSHTSYYSNNQNPSQQQRRQTISQSPKRASVNISSLPLGPELSMDHNAPVSTTLDTQKAIEIIHKINTLENDIYPPTRIEIEKLLQHLRIQYSRSPSRFVHRLLGIPPQQRSPIRSNINGLPNKSAISKDVVLNSDGPSATDQLRDVKNAINTRRFVTYNIFSAMIHNVRPGQSPLAIKELFNLLAEKKEYTDNTQKSILRKPNDKTPKVPTKRYVYIMDMWSFLTLLKISKEEARCVYNLKASKLSLILEHLNKHSENPVPRPFSNISVGTSTSATDTDISEDSLQPNQRSLSASRSRRDISSKTTFTQTMTPSLSTSYKYIKNMSSKQVQAIDDDIASSSSSVADIGSIRPASTSPTGKYNRKHLLNPPEKPRKIDHYDTSVEISNRRRVVMPSDDELAHMSVHASLTQSPTKPSTMASTRRKHMKLCDWVSDIEDKHPSLLNGKGVAMALGKTTNTEVTDEKDFRYKRQFAREMKTFSEVSMDQILREPRL